MVNELQLSGGSFPLRISNVEFEAFTLTDRDHDELSSYVQSRMIEVARNSLEGINDPGLRQETLAAAISASTGIRWGSLEGSRVMSTVEGMCRLGYQMVKKKTRKSYEEFSKIFRNPNRDILQLNIEQVDVVFRKLHPEFEVAGEVEEGSPDTPKSN